MSDPFDKLNEALNVEAEIVTETPTKEVRVKPKEGSDVVNDYEYSRAQLYNLVEKGQEAIQGALEVAQSSDHPRAYEVAGNLIKHVADITEKLLDNQKKLKDIEEEKSQKGPTNVTNAMFVGSTSELQKMLKKMNSDK
jgi:uncharacterized protein YaaN involved in tellurite resistance|tara:strand:+ start:241 stop:654 length:414 start_codon:yes stop_codon:yes gene_type:complete